MKITEAQQATLEKAYFKCKEELDLIRDEATLKKWKVLTKAHKKGKKIWGPRFSIVQLAKDMSMPLTTVQRCMALDRVNKKNWELHKKGKISAFKLAMIASSKNRTYQDEIVQMVIKDNLSTYQIKGLKINGMDDVNKFRHAKAVEEGYARKDTAANAILSWIDRGKTFMLMDKTKFGKKNYDKIEARLSELHAALGMYLEDEYEE